MHIVFLVGTYYPNYSAVGKCIGNVAEVLAKKNKVTVICEKDNMDQLDKEIYNDQTILRFTTSDMKRRLKLMKLIGNTTGLRNRFYKILLILFKIQQVFKLVFSKTSVKGELVSSYISSLKDVKETIDFIIPASMPFESVIAAYQYKKNFDSKVKLIPYLFDKFTDSKTLHRFTINRLIKHNAHIQLENKVLSESNRIIAMHSLKRFYNENLSKYNNIIYTEHPLIVRSEYKKILPSLPIKIAYIGGFYKNYVEPNYLLKMLSISRIPAKCDFYTIGNCDSIINKYSKKNPLRIVNKGSVDKETASKKISENHILISVAEKNGLQLSSKIFDYISHGKPIIHFYQSDNDINVKILKDYPLALCIKEDMEQLAQNIKIFDEFCIKNYKENVSWDRIIELYPEARPEFTAQLIDKNIVKVKSTDKMSL